MVSRGVARTSAKSGNKGISISTGISIFILRLPGLHSTIFDVLRSKADNILPAAGRIEHKSHCQSGLGSKRMFCLKRHYFGDSPGVMRLGDIAEHSYVPSRIIGDLICVHSPTEKSL